MHRSAAFHLGVVLVVALAAGWLWCVYGLDVGWLGRATMVLGVLTLSAFVGTFASLGVLLVIDPALKRVSRTGMLVIFGGLTLLLAWGLFSVQDRFAGLAWVGSVATVVGALVVPGSILMMLGLVTGAEGGGGAGGAGDAGGAGGAAPPDRGTVP